MTTKKRKKKKPIKDNNKEYVSPIECGILNFADSLIKCLSSKFKFEYTLSAMKYYVNEDNGMYIPEDREISIALKTRPYYGTCPYFPLEEIIDTCIHEAAHAKVHQDYEKINKKCLTEIPHHGKLWVDMYRKMKRYVEAELS